MLSKLTLSITTLVFVTVIVSAQSRQKRLDSLNKLNDTYLKQDTIKVIRILDVARAYQELDNNKSYEKSVQALALAKKLDNRRLLGLSYLYVGQGHNFLYRYKDAMENKEKAVAIFKELKNNTLLATTMYNMGLDYFRINEWYKGLDYFQQSLALARETKQVFGEIVSLIQIGISYHSLANYNKALDAQLEALKIAERINNTQLIGTCYNSLAGTYLALSNTTKAERFYEQALVLKLKSDDKPGIVASYINLANVATEMGKNAQARTYYNKANTLSEQLGYKLAQIKAEAGEGLLLYKEKRYDAALQNFQRELMLSNSINENVYIAESHYNIANVYANTGKLTEAEQHYLKAQVGYRDAKDIAGERNVNESLSELYVKMKDFDKAYDVYKKYIALRDTISNNEIKIQVSRKEMQFDFDKKESNYLLNQKIANQQIAEQQILAVQQTQLIQLNKQKLELVSKEKGLERLAFLKKQSELTHSQELQKVRFEKKQAQSDLNAAKRDRKISEQQEQISFDKKIKLYLASSIFLVMLIACLIFYNQRRTAKLNRIISIQKKELEQMGNVKDRIFSIVSHDMRTPVNALISFIQLLENGTVTPEKMFRYAGSLKQQLTHTSNLMENLLNWASTQMQGFVPIMEEIELSKLVIEVTDAIFPQIVNKNQLLEIEVSPTLVVNSDRNMASLIIRNLLSNAVKYTPALGLIRVVAETTPNGIVLSVIDRGIGMTSVQLAHFNDDNYIRSEKSTPGTNLEKGTGLGLMLCKSFTAILGAKIQMKKNDNVGITASLDFLDKV
jgi:signal transduction histidine kinase